MESSSCTCRRSTGPGPGAQGLGPGLGPRGAQGAGPGLGPRRAQDTGPGPGARGERMVFCLVWNVFFGLDHLNGVFMAWNPLLSGMVFFPFGMVSFLAWITLRSLTVPPRLPPFPPSPVPPLTCAKQEEHGAVLVVARWDVAPTFTSSMTWPIDILTRNIARASRTLCFSAAWGVRIGRVVAG